VNLRAVGASSIVTPELAGWLASALAHIGMVGVAVHLTSSLTLVPMPESFRLELTMAEAPAVREPERPAPAAPKAAPQSTAAAQPIAPPPPEQPKVEPTPTPETIQTVIQELAPMVAAVHAPSEPAEPATATVVATAPMPAIVEPPGAPASAAASSEPVAPAPAVAASISRGAGGGGRADYGWLADSIWRRASEIQRYPFQARLNHLEGRVVVRAVIRHDGHLEALAVHETSGHRVLDEEALELIRRVCPLHMKHELGRQQVAVLVPVNYKLND